jgi:hypothetical protein
MASTSVLIADSSSSRVFAGFFNVLLLVKTADHRLWLSRASACRAAGVNPWVSATGAVLQTEGGGLRKLRVLRRYCSPSSKGATLRGS